jgi:hypothetical protein
VPLATTQWQANSEETRWVKFPIRTCQGEWKFLYKEERVRISKWSLVILWFEGCTDRLLSASADSSVVNVQSAQCLHSGKLWMLLELVTVLFLLFSFLLFFAILWMTPQLAGGADHFIALFCFLWFARSEEVWEQMEVQLYLNCPADRWGQFLV